MQCEMCGKETDSLKKTKVEGAVLRLCSDCQETGDVVKTRSSKRSRKKSRKKSRKPRKNRKHLVRDFDDTFKQAREDQGYSMEELAQEMGVKTSIVRRIEAGSLKPDERLAKKIRKTLGIKLYEKDGAADYDTDHSSSSGSRATVGDVARVRKR